MSKRIIPATTRLALFGVTLIFLALVLRVTAVLGPPPGLFPEFLVTAESAAEYWRRAAQVAAKSGVFIVLAVCCFLVTLRMFVWVLKGLLPPIILR